MEMQRAELEGLDRETLVVRAQEAGIRRARILTRPELIDELLRLHAGGDEAQLSRSRGFFGRARDLLARVVERGLHLPDAADRIRSMGGEELDAAPRVEPQAIPTVTLAQIYAAQGHVARAVETLRRVLEREPDHFAAQVLLAKLQDDTYVPPTPPLPPEPEVEAAPRDAESVASAAERDAEAGFEPEPPTHDLGRGPIDSEAPTQIFTRALQDEEELSECFAVALPEGAGYVRFRALPAEVSRARAGRAEARLVVRLVVIAPTPEGPRTTIRDHEVEPGEGELVLDDLPQPGVLRAAVGVASGESFVPLASSPAFEARRRGGGLGLVRWSLLGTVPVVLEDARAEALERAWRSAR
jgi:hypothetical protein